MFKSGKQGERNFDRCQARDVSFTTYYRPQGSFSKSFTKTKPETTIGYDIKYSASLDCPRTEDKGLDTAYVYGDKKEALSELGGLAAEVICKNCIYSTMTPAEIDRTRGEELQARTHRLQMETAYQKALQEHRQVMNGVEAELEETTKRVVEHLGEMRLLEEGLSESD